MYYSNGEKICDVTQISVLLFINIYFLKYVNKLEYFLHSLLVEIKNNLNSNTFLSFVFKMFLTEIKAKLNQVDQFTNELLKDINSYLKK